MGSMVKFSGSKKLICSDKFLNFESDVSFFPKKKILIIQIIHINQVIDNAFVLNDNLGDDDIEGLDKS